MLKLHIGEERKREWTTRKEFARKLTLVFLLQFLVVFGAVADVYPVTTKTCNKSAKMKKGTGNASLTSSLPPKTNSETKQNVKAFENHKEIFRKVAYEVKYRN